MLAITVELNLLVNSPTINFFSSTKIHSDSLNGSGEANIFRHELLLNEQ